MPAPLFSVLPPPPAINLSPAPPALRVTCPANPVVSIMRGLEVDELVRLAVVITGCVECSAGSQAAPASQRDPDRRTRNRVGACVDREGVSRTGRPCYRDRSDAAKGSSCSGSVGGDGHGLGASIRIERHIRA